VACRSIWWRCLSVVAGLVLLSHGPVRADDEEPTEEQCLAAVKAAEQRVAAMSEKALSRYFADNMLKYARIEGGNGEYDECLEKVEKAIAEIEERRHWLAPGEVFRVRNADGSYFELRGEDEPPPR
jgi:uncharacterized protein with von Willebrand factor type A (vWA) domain